MKARLLALAFGFFLVAGSAYAGPLPGGTDTDGDTVENAFDNCTSVTNSNQADTDHNGCGNSCTLPITCDFNGDTAVGAPDFLILGPNFGMAGTKPNGDCNNDGQVGAPDFLILGMEFGNQVGPSGITSAQCNPATCKCTPQ